ncbi:MAG: hypothetical protein K8T20_17240, partial [Planctomycetes bacterium]|nr:hypothetical protein [Planctomycetota bacterium]
MRTLALFLASGAALLSQDPTPDSPDAPQPSATVVPAAPEPSVELSAAGSKAASAGIKWLLASQNEDGSWGEDVKCEAEVACTAMAGLAILSSGDTGRDGPGRTAVAKAARWTTKRALAGGRSMRGAPSSIETYLGAHIGEYLACAFLAEAAGMVPETAKDETTGQALRRLVKRIESWQKPDGSWNDGIEPLTTTAIAYVALRAAHNAGVTVKDASLDRVIEYVESRINTATKVLTDPVHGERERFTGAAGALRVILGLGRESTPEARTASAILQRLPFGRDYGDEVSGEDFFGGVLASHAMIHDENDAWRAVFGKVEKVLVSCQNSDGSWTGHHCISA